MLSHCSSAAMKNSTIGKIQEDFVFVIGGEAYKCGRILSELLSPQMCLSHSVES
jgi:hypothetical protein